ncbi:hypothetical protein D4764_0216960 [Takifugu flavidus]|uniref:Uncharacterized protein n=1 Tax=Takifugu flavidus TaxID=433684 RepID=A0A5C6MIX6_9TELE|nr:hypothetical protein D4764_0216960 [Takifugu flavidus]
MVHKTHHGTSKREAGTRLGGYRGPDPEPGLGLGLDGERLVWTHHPQDKHEGSGAVWIGR